MHQTLADPLTTIQQDIDRKTQELQNHILTNLPTSPSLSVLLRRLCQLMDEYDEHLTHHGWRTACYARILGNAIGLPTADLALLHYSGILHDIGKLLIPLSILEKHGPLTGDEYALIECHPRAGSQLLMQFPSLCIPAIWIAHHHERWDGYGYPYGLKGYVIPSGARILAVVDTFDALFAPKPFGHGYSLPRALSSLDILAGSQLDPHLVAAFSRVMKENLQDDLSYSICLNE